MRYRHHIERAIWVILVLAALGSGCHRDMSPGTPAEPAASGGQLPDALVGTVIGTISQQPVAGVTVSINTHSAITDAAGNFRLNGVEGTGNVAVRISGEPIYPRLTFLALPHFGTIQFDAIEKHSGFHLGFYRELARGNHPTEQNLLPIHRWTSTTAPTFYIDTNARATHDSVISEDTLALVRDVIVGVLPVFSGGLYTTASIQTQEFSRYSFDALPSNSIVISFDDGLYARGGIGLTITEPDCLSMDTSSLDKAWIFVVHHDPFYLASRMSKEEILAHELGHGFGYRHTSLLPSIMNKTGGKDRIVSEHDRLHAAVMYARPVGNTDIDNDPERSTTGKAFAFQREVFFDPVPSGVPLPPDILSRLQSLPGLADELLHQTPP